MNKILEFLLKINDNLFKYFFELFLILLILDVLEKGIVLRLLHFPLFNLFIFVAASGLLKLFFNREQINDKLQENSVFIEITQQVFNFSLIFYLVLLLVREFETDFVNKYFGNTLNWILGLVIASGAITAIFGKEEQIEEPVPKSEIKLKNYLFIILLGITGGGLIFYKTKELGEISWAISGISGLLIILLSVIILDEDEED